MKRTFEPGKALMSWNGPAASGADDAMKRTVEPGEALISWNYHSEGS